MDAGQDKASITALHGVELDDTEKELFEASVDGLLAAMRCVIAKFNIPMVLQATIVCGATDDPRDDGMHLVGVPRLLVQQAEGSA